MPWFDKWRQQSWLGPEVTAAALTFVVFSIIIISRDFGFFLLGLFALPLLLFVTLACMIWSVKRGQGARSVPMAMAIIVAALPLMRPIQAVWDWGSVAAWSIWHRQEIATLGGRDAVVAGWADRGWAGGSTFSYISHDARDDSGSVEGAERWRQRLKLDCPVTASERIWRGLYLVETTDCPFDGIVVPE